MPEAERPAVPADAVQAARAIQDEAGRAGILGVPAPLLPEAERPAVLADAVQAARAIQDDDNWLHEVGRGLSAELGRPLVEQAQVDHRDAGRMLGALVPLLPEAERPAVLADALQAARAIRDDGDRAWVLGALVPLLPEAERPAVLTDALQAARAINSIEDRARMLGPIAILMPESKCSAVLAEALQTAQAIPNDSNRANTLDALTPYLPVELLGPALEATRAIHDDDDRTKALRDIAKRIWSLRRHRIRRT